MLLLWGFFMQVTHVNKMQTSYIHANRPLKAQTINVDSTQI